MSSLPSLSAVKKLLGKPSVASWRSWFKSKALPITFTTRDKMATKLVALVGDGTITETDLVDGRIAIEESGNKLVYLYKIDIDPQALGRITKNMKKFGIALGTTQTLAPQSTNHPATVYAVETPDTLRIKWAEGQTKWISNLPKQPTYRDVKQTKIIVFVLHKKSGHIELRYDKPERDHSHLENGRITKEAYLKFYRDKVENICGVTLEQLELRPKLDKIIKTVPRIVEVMHNEELTDDGFTIKWTAKQRGKDVRDGKNYVASDKHGGTVRTQERESVKWLPDPSKKRLTRAVSTYIDGKTGYIRFDAYCHDLELKYVLEHFV